MNLLRILTIVVVHGGLLAGTPFAAGDDFQLGIDEAKSKIENYERARASGDPNAIREATVRLQRDPLAVRVVYENSPDAFKAQLNSDISAVQNRAKALVGDQLANLGIDRGRIGAFEATNKPKAGSRLKVPQDWDFTLRIDNRDIPTRVSQPLLHKAYYEASTGQKAPSVEAANKHAHRQSVAITDYQYAEAYGGSPREGSGIINGAKDARLRDPVQITQVIQYKSNEARNLAADLRKEANDPRNSPELRKQARAEAVGWDIEEMRQSTKQFNTQVSPRVEGMKGTMPEYIREGQKIMDRVAPADGSPATATPAEATQQLKELGQKHGVRSETPQSFIRKSAELVEAAQVLQRPSTRGAPAPDMFVENVKDRLANRQLVKQIPELLEKLDKGEITTEQAREQIKNIKEIDLANVEKPTGNRSGQKPLTEGISSFAETPGATARRQTNNALMALWGVSTAGEAGAHEGVRAAESGLDPNILSPHNPRLRAAANAMLEATMLPGIKRSFEHGQEIGKAELKEAEKEGRGKTDAFLRGAGEVAKDLAGINLGTKIAQEEIAAEEARAKAEGREPDYSKSAMEGMIRGLGEVTMINSIARSANSLTEEEVMFIGQQQVMHAWAQGKLNENLKELNGLKNDLQQLAATGDPKDPAFAEKLKQASEKYDTARLAMADLADATGRQLNENDPLVKAIKDRVGKLPDPPTAEDIQKARDAEALAAAKSKMPPMPESKTEGMPPVDKTAGSDPPQPMEEKRDYSKELAGLLKDDPNDTPGRKLPPLTGLTLEELERKRREAQDNNLQGRTQEELDELRRKAQMKKDLTEREMRIKEEYDRRARDLTDSLEEKKRLEDRYRQIASQLNDKLQQREAWDEYQRALAEYNRKRAEWEDYRRRWQEWDAMYPVCPKCGLRHPADWVEQ